MPRGQGNGVQRLLVCRVGSALCGLPIEHVVETMRPLPFERLSKMPGLVRGVSVVRGRPLPVLDSRLLLDGVSARPAGRAVTLALGERQVSLLVDEVIGIRAVDVAQLSQVPPLLREAAAEVEALGMLDAELLVVLQSARLLSEEHLFRWEAEAT